jgi:hypothetical protein
MSTPARQREKQAMLLLRHCPELSLGSTSTPNPWPSIVARSETLGLQAWRDKIQAIFRCVAYDHLSPENCAPWKRRYEEAHSLVDQLDSLEQKERLSLLELAVWKALCLVDMPAMTVYVEAMEWHAYKWQSNKSKYRRSNASAVIVAAVLLFQ